MVLRALRDAAETTEPGEVDPTAGAPIGGRIRELRKAHGKTLQDVATAVGISVSYLSQIERDVSRLPIDVLNRIAEVFGVHMHWFFHGTAIGPPEERDVIVRAANRRTLSFPGLGIHDELLSPNLAGPLELVMSTIDPGADSEFYTHGGSEAGLVIEGQLDLWLEDRHFRLDAGDTFSFDSHRPHRCANTTLRPVTVLWVVTPPHY